MCGSPPLLGAASCACQHGFYFPRGLSVDTVTSQQPVTEGYCKLLHVSIWRFESHIVVKAVSDDRRLH